MEASICVFWCAESVAKSTQSRQSPMHYTSGLHRLISKSLLHAKPVESRENEPGYSTTLAAHSLIPGDICALLLPNRKETSFAGLWGKWLSQECLFVDSGEKNMELTSTARSGLRLPLSALKGRTTFTGPK